MADCGMVCRARMRSVGICVRSDLRDHYAPCTNDVQLSVTFGVTPRKSLRELTAGSRMWRQMWRLVVINGK